MTLADGTTAPGAVRAKMRDAPNTGTGRAVVLPRTVRILPHSVRTDVLAAVDGKLYRAKKPASFSEGSARKTPLSCFVVGSRIFECRTKYQRGRRLIMAPDYQPP